MYLTPPSPSRTKFFSNKLPHEVSPPRYTHHNHESQPPPTAHNNYLPALQTSAAGMTTHHRGLERNLPPPPGPSLPDPLRAPSSRQAEYEQARSALPPPTPARRDHGYERSDYRAQPEYRTQPEYRERAEYRQPPEPRPTSSSDLAKVEELRYHQEAERTKQEDLRARAEEAKLGQRRLEQDIIREAMRYQTHPNLIPLIFVGLGSANSGGFETAQQYISTIQQIQTHFSNQLPPGPYNTASPDLRRDYRTTPAGPMQYGALGQQLSAALGSQSSTTSAPGTGVYPSPAYQTPQSGHLRQVAGASALRQHAATMDKPPSGSSLPRLSTNEAQVSAGAGPGHGQAAAAALAQGASQPGEQESPIFFHHWQPPATQGTAGKEPNKTSPQQKLGQSQSSEASPRKRKHTGPHEPAPRPSSSSAPKASSPSFSTISTSSKRGADRRKESVDSGHEGSRAVSKEPQLKTEISVPESEDTSRHTSAPTSAPTSTEIPPKPNT